MNDDTSISEGYRPRLDSNGSSRGSLSAESGVPGSCWIPSQLNGMVICTRRALVIRTLTFSTVLATFSKAFEVYPSRIGTNQRGTQSIHYAQMSEDKRPRTSLLLWVSAWLLQAPTLLYVWVIWFQYLRHITRGHSASVQNLLVDFRNVSRRAFRFETRARGSWELAIL